MTAAGLTQLNCDQPEGIMEQEFLYLQLLEKVEEYRIGDDGMMEMLHYVQDDQGNKIEKILLEFEDLRALPL